MMGELGWYVNVLAKKPRSPSPIAFEKPLPTVSINNLKSLPFGRIFEYIYLSFIDDCLYGVMVSALDSLLERFDILITPSPLVTLHVAKRRKRPKIIQFVSGAWADNVSAKQRCLKHLAHKIERVAYERADYVVFMEDEYAKRFALEKDRFEIIPCGIDLSIFDPSRFDRDKLRKRYSMTGKTAVVTVATLRRGIKGHDVLLRSISHVVAVHPECHFFLAGTGDQLWLRKLAESLGIDDHLHFLGECSDIPELLSASDIFVLPSRSEGLGIALIEAMAMKLPCIATRVGGVPSVVTHQRDGILVEPDDPEAISRALLHLISDQKMARMLGENARKRVITGFSLEATAKAYVELIDRLCE
jgi:glycosyltransferase involved in cell wall biosynthesis